MISNILKKSNSLFLRSTLSSNKFTNVTILRNSLFLNNNNNDNNTNIKQTYNKINFFSTTVPNQNEKIELKQEQIKQEQQQQPEQQPEQQTNKINNEIELKIKILENSLKYVNSYGWTSEAVSKACIEMGYPPITQGILGEDSAYELALYFVTKCNTDLMIKLSDAENSEQQLLSGLSKKEKVKLALKLRLSMIKPFIGRWSEAMQLLANPKNIVNSSPSMLTLVDNIWYLVGDKSSDFDWYAKRGLLIALYTSAELFMLSDTSVDHSNTWRFVDDRVDDLIKTIKFKNDIEETVGITLNTFLQKIKK
ncbi:ubiquinone biosynthesis protein [Dictyostelium discoideum AX4]|uniref:Probable ubiquinone biosynthesis protein coq9, mitochondrial n=1 Tax=Dictyostelium discoideum TaxID=44689 RepID=COQ9_DICDI|nr:ubiquinone biosynthesis protein [Dictyostelium discoideum AX4]Q86HS0.2 RecName: Full=Probable ubiquinone biosynthesis protein coq9, mitochondrial; Flags: Precursor [Dictyostelium discoideum]EAL70121.2 ubiquinone biosynthesis protein [Dictyostelium discoideum AX4]|eukprot:XP_644168.2 ubiquinone biosynthesis protein [Dictyostelium discoideum AX4]